MTCSIILFATYCHTIILYLLQQLHCAVLTGTVPDVKKLIEGGASVEKTDEVSLCKQKVLLQLTIFL